MTAAPRPWRRLIAPGIAAFIVFWVLIAMGVWQLQRLKWKEGIIASIREAQVAAPVPLPDNPSPFQKVIATGTWVPGKAALYGDEVHDTPNGPVPGAELIMPLRLENGAVVLVDLGWVPETAPAPLAGLPGHAVGYVHAPLHADWTSGADDPAKGLYYTLDPAKIGTGMGLTNVAPYSLIALGPIPPPGSQKPQPQQDLPTPPNNHYEYALTWFGFAGVLVFQFIFFARKRLLEP
ncbi:MAG TPA: SURF1 family protein [Acidocella sp.]|jgi:surfeit locus 1 family protein|nr:SURF1 family protein [Acidocella sp.]